MDKVKWKISDILIVLALTFVLLPLVSYTLGHYSLFLNIRKIPAPYSGLIAFLIQDTLLLLFVCLFTIWRYKAKFSDFGFRPIKAADALVYGLGGLLLCFVLIFFVALIFSMIGIPGFSGQGNEVIISELFGKSLLGLVLAFVITGIFVPFVEELFFRGFLFKGLKNYISPLASAIITSIIFASAHLSLTIAGPIFIIGLVLCWLYQKNDNIWPGIVLHALKNISALLLLYLI